MESLYGRLAIATSEGIQLDRIGAIVGAPRPRALESERDYQIRVDRPRYFDPSIVVIYTDLDGAPKRIDTRIREALKDKTFTIGEPVIYSRLWGIITCEVPGVQIDALEINGATGNITVDPDQKVRFLGSNITVEEQ